jgi:integrase
VAENFRSDDPTQGLKLPRAKTRGIQTWTEAEIEAIEGYFPIGTRPRRALALLLYTAQRRSDVIHLGRQHVRDGALTLRQRKTGATLEIPLHEGLQKVLASTPSEHLTFLVTQRGQPFTEAGFGNWFRDCCDRAGLPKHCSAHGLRKAACRRLAEAGCTEKQIAAISGHLRLSEVQRYTKAADQARLGRDAMRTVSNAFPEPGRRTLIGKPSTRFAKTRS